MADASGFTGRQLFGVIRRRGWIVILFGILGASAGVAVASMTPLLYEASTKVVLTGERPDSLAETPIAQDPARSIQTHVELIQSKAVADEVRARLGKSAAQIDSVAVTPVGTSDVLEIRIMSPQARAAKEAADTYAEVYVAIREERINGLLARAEKNLVDQLAATAVAGQESDARLVELRNTVPFDPAAVAREQAKRDAASVEYSALQQQLEKLKVDSTVSRSDVEIVERSVLPRAPVGRPFTRDGMLGAALGVLVGLALAVLAEQLADRATTAEDLFRYRPDLRILGEIPVGPELRGRRGARVVATADPASQLAEAYRALRMGVRAVVPALPATLLITSPNVAAGKTTTAVNLSVTMARAGTRVVLLDFDLRNPGVSKSLDIEPRAGITSVLSGETSLRKVLLRISGFGGEPLLIAPAGPEAPNAGLLFEGAGIQRVVESAREHADLVIIDAPPLLGVADALVLCALVDGVMLVVGSNVTRRRDVDRATRLVQQADGTLLGVVLNYTLDQSGYAYAPTAPRRQREADTNGERGEEVRPRARSGRLWSR